MNSYSPVVWALVALLASPMANANDYSEAADWLTTSATDAGVFRQCGEAWESYRQADYSNALYLANNCIDNSPADNADARVLVAILASASLGMSEDPQLAFRTVEAGIDRLSTENPHALAYAYGVLLYLNRHNQLAAEYWLIQAAEQGSPDAHRFLNHYFLPASH